MRTLDETYEQLKSILGEHIEPLHAVHLVNEYREYWRPRTAKVILLAESHVFTNESDMSIRYQSSLPGYPTRYAKFVYCLAYGERELTGSAAQPRLDGTPQFWKVFYACLHLASCNQDFAPVLRATPHAQRLANKIALLQRMKEKGIWLVDTSIVALYHKGKKPKSMHKALRCSWDNYTSAVIRQASPEHVICIGKDVGKIVGADLNEFIGNDNVTILPQPNAFLSSAAHLEAYQTYFRVCSSNICRHD